MNSQAKLHFVLGHSAVGANGVDVCQQSQSFAYIAGPCAVIRSLAAGREHIVEASDSPLTCISLSACGRYVATGESGSACVRVHNAQPSTSNDYSPLVLSHHSHGIAALKFVPHSPLLVSVGVQQDAQICLWNWQTGKLIESAKLAANVKCVALSDDNTVLVTAGEKHLKFWSLGQNGFAQSRSAILANQRSSVFLGCVFLEPNRVLAVTEEGNLVEFVNKKYVNAYQWDDVQPTSIAVAEEALILGCSSGTVALHSRTDLSPLSSLPQPVPSKTDPASVSTVDALQRSSMGQALPAVVSVSSTPDGHVVSVHADRSLYVHSPSGRDWRRLYSDVSHCGPITALITCPQTQSMFPEGSFISGGADGSVRIWNRSSPSHADMAPYPQTNLLSPSLKKILFLEEDRATESSQVEVSSLSLSPDGHHLAVGTKSGNIHIYDATMNLARQETIPAHDGDVFALGYSDMNPDGVSELFASGGRDGLIHIFKPSTPSYTHHGVLEEHKFALKTLCFARAPSGDFCLFSGAADGTLLVHRVAFINQEQMEICRLRQLCMSSAAMSILPNVQAVLIACEDGSLRYLTPEGDDLGFAEPSKDSNKPHKATSVSIDSSGTMLALCDTDRTLLVRSRSGRVISRFGVGATASSFSADGRKLLVASENGCLYSWKLAKSLQASMAEDRSLLEQQLRRSPSTDSLLGSGSEGFVDEATTSTSVLATEWDSDESERTQPEIVLRTEASRSALTVRPAQVTRRSNSNLLAALEADHHDFVSSEEVDESQSDFVSRRDRLSSPLPTPSKSMLNIRDGGVQLLPPSLDTERPQRRQRGGWGPPQQSPPENEWRQPTAAFVHSWASPAASTPQYATVDVATTPLRRPLQPYQRGLTEGGRRLSESPSSVAIAQIQSISRAPPPPQPAFRRESEHRVSLSKRHMDGHGPKAVWSAHAMTPKRTTMPTTPSGAAASAITRRPDDYQSSPLHLRSRSQSPNHMALSQLASRELSQQINRRRDSDMSYTAVSSRLAPASSKSNLRDSDMRKSTDALNRMAALRKQMHQSSENLRKSTDNLAVEDNNSSSVMGSRARSISNLRGAHLEAAGSFDADRIPGSLAQSRMLARSMGNVSQSDNIQADDMPTNRLQNALSALRKASNPDLTQASLYDDGGITLSADKTRRRGAVQKKVERYHPRNRTGRQQTSEESDSNTSDASFLNQSLGRRLNSSGGIRSVSAVGESPRGLQSRRIYEQQQSRVNSQRKANYLTQKLAGEDLPGPDLGSDDSPRSSVNASEWSNLLDDSSDCQQLVKHVQDCCDQHRVHTDRLLQARKMVEGCSLTLDQKRIIMSQIDREMEKSVEKLNFGRRISNDSNGNDYQPLKGVQALKQGFQNLHFK